MPRTPLSLESKKGKPAREALFNSLCLRQARDGAVSYSPRVLERRSSWAYSTEQTAANGQATPSERFVQEEALKQVKQRDSSGDCSLHLSGHINSKDSFMNHFFSVFRRAQGSAYSYACGGSTLADETKRAQSLAANPAIGEYLYSRTAHQAPLSASRLYRFVMSRNRLRYCAVDEEPLAPFDYLDVHGSHQDELLLPVLLEATVDNAGIPVRVTVAAKLKGVQSFKFKDLTERLAFGVRPEPGGLKLVGYQDSMGAWAQVEIPLTLMPQ